MIRCTHVIVAALVAVLLVGCSPEPEAPPPPQIVEMPEVNDENCKPQNVAKVPESVRVQFGTACSRRGSFKPSTGKTW